MKEGREAHGASSLPSAQEGFSRPIQSFLTNEQLKQINLFINPYNGFRISFPYKKIRSSFLFSLSISTLSPSCLHFSFSPLLFYFLSFLIWNSQRSYLSKHNINKSPLLSCPFSVTRVQRGVCQVGFDYQLLSKVFFCKILVLNPIIL